jgi:hypothetical protein
MKATANTTGRRSLKAPENLSKCGRIAYWKEEENNGEI